MLLEQSLGNCIHKIYDLVETYKKTKTGQKQIMPMIKKYYPGRYDDMDVEDFIKLHESKPIEEVYYLNVGCFSDYTPDRVQKMMDELGVESQSEILMPEEELTDMEELKANLSPEEYSEIEKSMKGKFIKVDKKLQCGWMTLEELYHIPSYSNKVTTSMYTLYNGDVNSKTDQPILGRGVYRQEGQKISEMDLWVLQARNAKKFISVSREKTVKEDNQLFLNNLLGLGLTITDNKGYNQGGSNLKNQLGTMKTKFRLKGQK